MPLSLARQGQGSKVDNTGVDQFGVATARAAVARTDRESAYV